MGLWLGMGENKKGAETNNAGSVAVLVALIALFIILYVLLLPPEARKELLQDQGAGVTNEQGVLGGKAYFSRFLGELSPKTGSNTIYHNVPAANLFTTSEKDLTTISDFIQVSSGFANSKDQNIAFAISSPEDIRQATLYTLVEEADGDLVLTLNGNKIYDNTLRSNVQESVEIPTGYLQKSNMLTVSVSSPGWMVWDQNLYKLRYLKLRKETQISNKVVESIISIPSSEWGSMEKAILKYSVFCSRTEDKALSIYVNDQLVYKDVPFCNINADEIEIDRSILISGSNKIRFETQEGDYLVESISLRTALKKETETEEVFFVSEDEYKDVRNGIKDVIAYIDFGNKYDRKILELYVNDQLIDVDTSNDLYTVNISNEIEKGGNSIRIKPKNTFEVIDFRVELA